MTDYEIVLLRRSCHTVLPGHRAQDAAAEFAALASYCTEHQIDHDVYGDSVFTQNFEQKIAELMGLDAGAFMVTGTLAQSLALRLACSARSNPLVGLHSSAHILVHENSNYQLLDHFKVIQLGEPLRTWRVSDLQRLPDRLAAVLLELPMRELGGQLPSWDELQDIKAYCKKQKIHLHLDGARLWEAQAAYRRSFAEIVSGFDSVYVSFYKGIGGLAGAMLLGRADFIARAKVWAHRQGGRVFRYSPYVISAAMHLEARLAALPACLARTLQVAGLIAQFPRLQINPATPHCNMFHLYLPVSAQRALEIRNEIARDHGVWLFQRASNAALPNQCMVEWTIGDNLLELSDTQVLAALGMLDLKLT